MTFFLKYEYLWLFIIHIFYYYVTNSIVPRLLAKKFTHSWDNLSVILNFFVCECLATNRLFQAPFICGLLLNYTCLLCCIISQTSFHRAILLTNFRVWCVSWKVFGALENAPSVLDDWIQRQVEDYDVWWISSRRQQFFVNSQLLRIWHSSKQGEVRLNFCDLWCLCRVLSQ